LRLRTILTQEAQRTNSALSGRHWDSPGLRGGETGVTGKPLQKSPNDFRREDQLHLAPPLSRTPSTNTITQSRANTQQNPVQTHSARSTQRSNLVQPKSEERRVSTVVTPSSPMRESTDTPYMPDSSSSSSSSSPDTDHPAHRSQLFKRPPRFKQQRPRDLSDFQEDAGVPGSEGSGSHDTSSLPFASSTRRPVVASHVQDKRFRNTHTGRQELVDNRPHASMRTEPPVTVPAPERDVPAQIPATRIPTPAQTNYRAEIGKANSPKQTGPRSAKEASEGTPSMGSSFSDIDGR
jgi:hypothetical protein